LSKIWTAALLCCSIGLFSSPSWGASTDWHCHLISLGINPPADLRPALEALEWAVHSTALEPRLSTNAAPDALVRVTHRLVKRLREQMRSSLKGPLSTKMERGIYTRVEKFNLEDPSLLQIMRGPKREVDEILTSYRDILRLAESNLDDFERSGERGIANHQALFSALNALAVILNPSGPFGAAKKGSFLEAFMLEDRDGDMEFFEFRRLVRLASFNQASIYELMKSRGSNSPYVSRIGALIPVDRVLTPYEDNQTIGLPVEYVSFAVPYGGLFKRVRARMERLIQVSHAFTSVMYASKTYGMVDILGNYARTMKLYQAARSDLPADYQVILDIVFSSVRFETNQNIALGPSTIKSLLKRVGVDDQGHLNPFTVKFLDEVQKSGDVDRWLGQSLDEAEFMAMHGRLMQFFQ
jgi:hypothetical protein